MIDIRIKRNTLSFIMYGLSIFLSVSSLSFIVSPLYTEGDQVFYRAFYETAGGASLSDVIDLSISLISSHEPVYILLTWLVADHVNKDIFMSLCNGFLAVAFLLAANRAGAQKWQAVFVVFSNFYFYVLYFGAERLKFAFIFIFLAYGLSINTRGRMVMFVLSMMSHAQSALITLPVMFLERFRADRFIWRWFHVVLLLTTIGTLAFYLTGHVTEKYEVYSSRELDRVGVLKLLPFMLLSAFYSRTPKLIALYFAPLCVAALLIGPERIVILGYFIFAYVACKGGRSARLFLLLANCYFFYKGIAFLENVIVRGSGFDDG